MPSSHGLPSPTPGTTELVLGEQHRLRLPVVPAADVSAAPAGTCACGWR